MDPFQRVFFSTLLLSLIFSSLSNHQCQSLITYNNPEYLKLRLLHRTSFVSPFDLQQTLASDSHRLFALFSTIHAQTTLKSPVISGASIGSGQYFVDFHIGSPLQKLLLVVDTGSDLIWVKCSACRNCTKHPPGSAFFARHSHTFQPIHCYNRACGLVPNAISPCNITHLHSPCRYEYTYADQSETSGIFARETVTLNTSSGREIELRKVAFGCGFNVSGPSLDGTNGVVGLGRGAISFTSQAGKRFGNKFSYCLMDYTIFPPPTSYLFLGDVSTSYTSKAKSKISFTPLMKNPFSPTFYYVGIERVTLQGSVLPIDPDVWSLDDAGNGGTVIDSGTTLTFLVEPAYRKILTAFRLKVKYPTVDPILTFDLCVNVTGTVKPRFPKLRFYFLGGVVFSPPVRNYFISAADGVKCLALQAVNSPSGFSVIGNLLQQGFLFVFDRDESRLGFSRTGCSLL